MKGHEPAIYEDILKHIESCEIFITEHDVLEDGEQIYHVERMILETKKIFPDREHIIYVNGNYKDESGSALGDLIHDFFCENPADMRHLQLAERVKFLKDNKSGVRKMCKIIEDLQNESKKEILLDSIRNLMETMKWSAEQAMEALKIPVDKQNEYRQLI